MLGLMPPYICQLDQGLPTYESSLILLELRGPQADTKLTQLFKLSRFIV